MAKINCLVSDSKVRTDTSYLVALSFLFYRHHYSAGCGVCRGLYIICILGAKYIYTNTHTYTHTYTHIYKHTCTQTHTYTCTHTYKHTYTCTYINTHTHAHTHKHMHTNIGI